MKHLSMASSEMDSKNRNWVLLAVAFVLIGGLVYWTQTGYGKIGPRAYRYAFSLYSACLAENYEQLEKAAEMITSDSGENEMEPMTAQESRWLMGVVEMARSGDWGSAAQAARQIMSGLDE
ncbi:MAG: hypothetical protein AAF623_05095 [Planctomycetota bacterium]